MYARSGVVPPGVVTAISTSPATWAGVTNDTEFGKISVGVIAGPPSTDTVDPDTKSAPVKVTSCPPTTGPLTGSNDSALGTARYT